MGDETLWDNLNGAHYNKTFYTESYQYIQDIMLGHSKQKVYSCLSPHVVADIFRSKLTEEELVKYLLNVKNPFCTGLKLDESYCELSVEEIVAKRQEIIEQYSFYE